MTSQLNLSKKYFGNCKVEWMIEGFSLQTFGEIWLIKSPEFTINGSENTRWRMSLRPKPINGSCLVWFNLRKFAAKLVSVRTWISVKICKKIKAKYVCLKEKVLCIENRSTYEMSLGSKEYLLSSLMDKSDDSLTIICHMIVYNKSGDRKSGTCKDAGLRLLSRNMSDLYASAQNYDTRILVGENVILAHKAVLYARNDYLSCIIEQDDVFQDYSVVNLSYFSCDIVDFQAIRRAIAYMYTGDICHVLEDPSFAVHRCISFLEIREMELFYEPDKLVLISTIDFEEYGYILRGYEFENSHLIWHCYTTESTKTFRLLLYPEKNNRKDCVPLFTKTFEKSMIARLEFHFVTECDQKHTITALIVTDGDTFIDIDEIIRGIIKELDCSLSTFEVKINIKLTTGAKISSIEEHNGISVSVFNEDNFYESLSRNLEFLLEDGFWTDTVIDNNGENFEVHKCIIASRCRRFSDILEINEGEEAVVLNFDPYIFFVILTYLYTGKLKDVTDNEIFQIYKAAVSLKLFQLRCMCSDWLKIFSKANRNIRCRVVRIAEEYKDSSLMKSVLSDLFIRNEILPIPNRFIPFQDAHACSFCLPAS